jgi:hypothetical protein
MYANSTTHRPTLARALSTTGLILTALAAAEPAAASSSDTPEIDGARAIFNAPSLFYSTTFGGGPAEARDIAVDALGNTIIVGNTTGDYNFPLVNAADNSAGTQGEEGYVAKINAAGDNLVFSTYLGGQGNDWVTGVDVDADGNVYVVGITTATDFPTTGGTVQPSAGHAGDGFLRDAFVVKLDPLGNMVWSTYLGGNASDEAHGVKVGSDGSVYVVGTAMSKNFPTANAYQSSCRLGVQDSCQDAFVARLSADGSSLLFSTYLGGTSLVEVACSVDVDADGNVFVVGHHSSNGFPLVNPFQDTYGGGLDMFVTKFAPGGDSLVWSSGLGGNGNDAFCAPENRGPTIALDSQGDAFVASLTSSTNLPAPGGFQTTNAGTTDGYLAKITSGGTLEWASYLGGENSEAITEIAIRAGGGPLVVGWTTSRDFPQTLDALEERDCPSSPTPFCPGDVFVTAIAADGSEIEFSSFLGGSDFDQANGVAIGDRGVLHVAGTTDTELWPLIDPLPQAFRGSGGRQAFVVRIGDDAAPIPGDVNGDGVVTASDALAGLGAAIGTVQCLLCVCDLNGDGNVSATDALVILQLAVSIPVVTNPPAC